MRLSEALLEQSFVYRLWQAPFADQKFAPIIAHNDLSRVGRVLDVGCGPGTNCKYFTGTQYLGIDINPRYIAAAHRRYGLNFQAVDARQFQAPPDHCFDFILVNSFLHHLSANDVMDLLSHLKTLLTPNGCVHILEPEMPPAGSIAHFLAKADRGKFVRPVEEWRLIFSTLFHSVLFEPYPLRVGSIVLWRMLYFKGGR